MCFKYPSSSSAFYSCHLSVSAADVMATNCTAVPNLLEMYYLPIMYGLEFILGFLGNFVVILSYILWLRQWKSINVYLFNLAVSDLVFLCTLPRIAFTYAWHQVENSPYFCLSNRFILHINLYASLLFMVLVSMDRYLLLQNPLRNHILLRCSTAIGLSVLSWILISAQVAPVAFFTTRDLKVHNWSICNDFGSLSVPQTSHLLAYSVALTVTGYIIPLLTLGLLSHRIACFLKTQEGMFDRRSVSFHRPLRMVLASVLMFLLLYSPYHIMRNVYIGLRQSSCKYAIIKSLYIISRPVAFSHSVINPAFYFFMGDQFKELLMSHIWRPRQEQVSSSQTL